MTFANMYGGVRTVKEERNENDFYPTHPFVTYALIQKEIGYIPSRVWEPAAGRGWMAWELNRNGFTTRASDLHAYEDTLIDVEGDTDFLKADNVFSLNYGVITNPPYGRNLAQKFIERSLSVSGYSAMLCRLTFAESAKRFKLFKLFNDIPPSIVYAFSTRFSCEENRWHTEKDIHSGMIAYAWWVWDNREVEATQFKWIDTKAMYYKWEKSLTDEQRDEYQRALPSRS